MANKYNLELIEEAKKYIGVKEVGTNSGPQVEAFQKAVDGKANKEAWCIAFLQYLIISVEKKFSVVSDLIKTEYSLALWDKSPLSCRLKQPEEGCIVVWQFNGGSTGHGGLVESILPNGKITTIEGNTADGTGIVREGDGVYRRTRTVTGSSTMKVLGFLRVFKEK